MKPLGTTAVRVIGLGTGIGRALRDRNAYDGMADIVRLAIDQGITFIDTAPDYGDGRAEEMIGQALQGQRHRAFLATKVAPDDLAYSRVIASAHKSLQRLKTDYLDLLQIHWPNPKIPITETMDAMAHLVRVGLVCHVGVSNFSLTELKEARSALGAPKVVSIQVEYNLLDRTVEEEMLPYCDAEDICLVAYSPLRGIASASGERRDLLETIGARHSKTVAQVALRWLVSHGPVIVIPNTTNPQRLLENAYAADFALTPEDIQAIDRLFPSKITLVPTEMIRVSQTDGHAAYTTLEQAIDNHLHLTPSPRDLAEQIRDGEFLKPVHLVHATDRAGGYLLVDGRVRYWAWVIAHDGLKPIPALIDD